MGADWPLVVDALQIAGLAGLVGATSVVIVLKMRKNRNPASPKVEAEGESLESRVQVLERIATDRSIDLADEIEALRFSKKETSDV